MKGQRLIAFSQREITKEEAYSFNQQDSEKELTLVGFMSFENELKEDTISVLKELKDSNLMIKVISGDNLFTTM